MESRDAPNDQNDLGGDGAPAVVAADGAVGIADAASVADSGAAVPDTVAADTAELGEQDSGADGPPPCQHPDVVPSCRQGFCTIPAGCFVMGSPATDPCHRDNEPLRQVTLTREFRIQSTEVTQAQFESLMGYNPACAGDTPGSTCMLPGNKGRCADPDCPVEEVSWHEAAAYCNELSTKEVLTQCYSCSGEGSDVVCQESSSFVGGPPIYKCPGYRLPTSAEWEYAYRAGTSTAYHSGADVTSCDDHDPNGDPIAWYKANSAGRPHPVGQKAPNAWGLHDMSGNVAEWLNDWFDPDPQPTPSTDPAPSSGYSRSMRGGSYYFSPIYMRAAYYTLRSPEGRRFDVGFRCVRTLFP